MTSSNGNEEQLLLTVEAAAKRLSIGRTKMFHLIATGQVRSVTIGTARRVPAEALTEFVSALLNEAQHKTSAA
ncbi:MULTISPECIES: excisionase family DNA-binding protein [Thermomonospora]|uniref:Excisionase family DNA binding protein n=1 Tax=Thermomonospora cellulosilytica TaxID=1411118 RepID=A0A7W3MUE2_9ACTN|nr:MULTISPECIES: excisionase family DNA-binding protein [Thermomonospora]MBA9002049.1 excisionase family DNA binding protein [Thermomonospora cellulosilytica]